MTQKNRHKRQEPLRTGPHRAFILTHDHPGGASSRSESTRAAGRGAGVDGVIAGAVDLGYQVIDEQMQQGQATARRLRQGSYTPEAIEGDVRALVDNLFRITKGAIEAWAQLLGAPRGGQGPRRSEFVGRGAFSFHVKGARRAHVTLNMRPSSARFVPVISELKSATPGKRSLTGAKFKVHQDRQSGALVIDLPDDLEPGVYMGDVVDSFTNEHGGTISVRIDS